MNDQETRDFIHGFLEAWTSGQIKQALALFTEESTWMAPPATFKGLAQIENYLTWAVSSIKDFHITENGNGIVSQGDRAFIEHELSGTLNGKPFKLPSACAWEFKDGKVANLRTYFDVLSQAQQVASGAMAKFAVNAVVKASQQGLPMP
jgi:ketosteroid isomerase-like protein